MDKLLALAKASIELVHDEPFSVYSSVKNQELLNVPVVKPLFVAVLAGWKGTGP